MNFLERKKPDVFKPIIDEYFLRIAQWAGVDTTRVANILSLLNAARHTSFEYLYMAARKVKTALFIEKVDVQLTYGYSRQLFNNPELNYVYVGETEYDYDPTDLESDDFAVVLENYPPKAAAALRQDKYWGGAAAEVAGVWRTKDGVERVYKASPAEFVILGEDPIDYFEQVIKKSFGDLPAYVPIVVKPLSFLPIIEDDEEEEEDTAQEEDDFDDED
jgi:hypothetical protein